MAIVQSPRRSCCGPPARRRTVREAALRASEATLARRARRGARRLRSAFVCAIALMAVLAERRRRRDADDPCPGKPVAPGRGRPRVGPAPREPRGARRQRPAAARCRPRRRAVGQARGGGPAAGRDVRRPLGLGRGLAPGPERRPRLVTVEPGPRDRGADDARRYSSRASSCAGCLLAGHRLLEVAQSGAERAAHLGQALGAEQQHHDDQQDRDVKWVVESDHERSDRLGLTEARTAFGGGSDHPVIRIRRAAAYPARRVRYQPRGAGAGAHERSSDEQSQDRRATASPACRS